MSTVFIRLPACLPPFKRVHSFPLFMFNNKYRKPLTEIFTVHVSSYTCVHLISHGVFMQWLKIEMAKLLTQLPPPLTVWQPVCGTRQKGRGSLTWCGAGYSDTRVLGWAGTITMCCPAPGPVRVIRDTFTASANQSPASRSRDHSQPIRVQYHNALTNGCWPLEPGRYGDRNTGLWLVESDHVTWTRTCV